VHLAGGYILPVDRKLDHTLPGFQQEEEQFHIEGKPHALGIGIDFFEGGGGQDLQPTLSVIGGNPAHYRDKGRKDASRVMADPATMDGASEHLDPTAEERVDSG